MPDHYESYAYEHGEHSLTAPRLAVEQIVGMFRDREKAMGPVHRQMRRVREAANGDVIVPLNELDRYAKADVANLMLQGLDQMRMRVASVMPSIWFPPISEGERSKKIARDRKAAIQTMWDDARMEMKLRRRGGHLLGYSSSAVMIRPDMGKMRPTWKVINPLDLFPCEKDDPDDPVPDNTIRAFSMPYSKLLHRYPQAMSLRVSDPRAGDQRITVIEYQDEYEVTQIALGADGDGPHMVGSARAVRLEWAPNRAGCPLVVFAERITLDKARGAFDDMLGMFYSRARLQALNHIAIEKGIFPNEWLVARPGEEPDIIQEADGRTGVVGIVKGGDIRTETLNPGYKTDTAIDRIERQERTSGGVPPEFGGESTSNIRTGRRGDAVLSATVDQRVQEAQSIFAHSLLAENHIAIRTELGYWGNAPKSFYFSGRAKKVDYVPNKLWEYGDAVKHFVSYAMPGTDINSLSVALGQKIGIGLMSKETARESDPLITDPDLEHDRIVAESIEAALLASIQAQANDPNGPYQPDDLAHLARLVLVDNKSLYEAIELTQKRAQERQATPAPEGAPETMPGLAMPGMGAEQPVAPSVPPPSADISNFAALMGQLRRPAAAAEAMV